ANVVTQDNFYEFFNDEGYLLDSVEFDELIFKGEFEDLVDHIVIERPLTITGNKATLNNIGFIIEDDDCTLDNLKFVADTNLGALILVDGVYGTTLSNLDITYDGGDEEAVAIEVEGDGVKILNNTIFFESHVPDDEVFAIGLKLTGCTDALVDGNDITTKLPCVYCNNYDEDYYMMGSDKVNPVRIKDCANLIFTNNNINSTTNDYSADFPTIQSIQIIGCRNSILDHNNISMIDEMTPAGMDNYLYGINFGYNRNVTFSNNNFNMSTKGGKDAAGTAYAFQGVESEVFIKGNSITSVSNGPNLGIYVASMFGGDSDLIITDNFINVTGSASSTGSWALVSGIEIQNGDAKIYNNTIYTYNVNEYDEYAYMYGISYAQWMYGDRSFDIQDNTVYTEGKYTISVINASSFNAERNVLVAHDLSGDDSINPGSCADVTIEDNTNGSNTEYTGIIYVSETGDDNNEGSIDHPVASIAHAVQIAAARDNKTSTVYLFNGDYTTEAIDINDDLGVSLSIIGEEKGQVTIHGTGSYIFDVYGDNLVWNFKNLDIVDVDSTARTSA
ncbi:MAG: adhesin, partial [Methanobrevibacter sp.]|nr:adhesin [Methanobrevibacter sp.]